MSQYLAIGVGGAVMLGLRFGEVILRWLTRRLGVTDPSTTAVPPIET
jgi:hypothetical protein